jgi:DNA-binding response OmpR family regulator
MHETGGGSAAGGILVVEDDQVIARLIERVFVKLGYSVQVATSCAEARVVADVFRCGIFDIELGDGSGVDLARAMLARGDVRAVVFYTGSLDSEARRQAAELGRVIDKLSPFAELREEVVELMSGNGEKDPGKA